jgi:23S rRNA pseudouridine1911/1915/1917 synthase
MHQIRIHFESIGYPLAVDAIYGRRDGFLLSEIKRKKYKSGKDQEERPLISRVILHARKLEFKHPTTNETMTFEAELPKDFRAVVNQLDKWG